MPIKFQSVNIRLRTWLLLHQAYDMVVKTEEAVFRQLGITPQQNGVLMAVKHSPKPVTVSAIADWLDRNPNTISSLVERMQKDGLIKGVRSTRDRREVHLALTTNGIDVAEKATRIGEQLINDLIGSFTESELHELSEKLETIQTQAYGLLRPGHSVEEMKSIRFKSKK